MKLGGAYCIAIGYALVRFTHHVVRLAYPERDATAASEAHRASPAEFLEQLKDAAKKSATDP